MDRDTNIKVFMDTVRLYQNDKELKAAVWQSILDQYVLPEREPLTLKAFPEKGRGEVVVSARRTFEAAMAYRGKKVCALNFASSKNPGGGVESGAGAQEECLCRISTLYPCLCDKRVFDSFYLPHRTMLPNTLYNSDLIFTPGVVCFKTDTDEPVLMPRENWFSLDVITCAAPNLISYTGITAGQLEALLTERLERVFITAVDNGTEVLILGAFGCGAFRDPPEIVAAVMKKLTEKYRSCFDIIEFAVYCPPKNTRNYDVFRSVLLS